MKRKSGLVRMEEAEHQFSVCDAKLWMRTLLDYTQAETKGQSRANKGEGEKRRVEDEWTDTSDDDERRLSSHDFTYFLKGTRVASHEVGCG